MHLPGNDPLEPASLGVGKRPGRVLVMAAVGVDAAEDDAIFEHQRLVERRDVERGDVLLAAEAGEADDAAGRAAGNRLRDDLRSAGAFDDDVELDARVLDVVLAAELADE